MAIETMLEWQRRSNAPLLELWGMTEIAGLGTTHALHSPPVLGSIGVSLPGVAVASASMTVASVPVWLLPSAVSRGGGPTLTIVGRITRS